MRNSTSSRSGPQAESGARSAPNGEAADPNALDLVSFHLTGERPGSDRDALGGPNLSPALFAGFRNLTKLRYDFPLVLAEGDGEAGFVRSLSSLIDGVLQETAPPGIGGERQRKQVLGLEEKIRILVAQGAGGSLTELWGLAESDLLSAGAEAPREELQESLGRARGALRCEGEIIDCSADTGAELITHAWVAVEEDKARRFRNKVNELILKLSDILKVDFMKSAAARTPASLRDSIGGAAHQAGFNFESMSEILGSAGPEASLPEVRQRRINSALSVLVSQRFVSPRGSGAEKADRAATYRFVFDGCNAALEAFHNRLPEVIELIKAISVAELEIDNHYRETQHDSFLEHLDVGSLSPKDLAPFPSYLVCLRDGGMEAEERARLLELLAAGLPIKILVQTDDLLGDTAAASEFSFGVKSLHLARMTIGLNETFVLQAASSHLYQLRDQILSGMRYQGPALYSVFAGSPESVSEFPRYLTAAAAMQARAFPTFTYDPGTGADWASRFSVTDNPQLELGWPVENFRYEDEDLQSIAEDIAFTFIDFVASDTRYAGHFSRVPRSGWNEGMVPVKKYLELDGDDLDEAIPYILMIDEGGDLHKVIVDEKLIGAARRCGEMWRSLQELGGINSSHAKRLLAREKEAWQEEKDEELAELRRRFERGSEGPVPDEAATPAAVEAMAEAEAEEALVDEPYVETPRCTTCDECTDLNNRMFAYDDNKQAYIVDPDAGSYRQLVEAAEACQVAIIHPGRPRNPKEPNLDELIARAEPFN